jgi:hypothetical protein
MKSAANVLDAVASSANVLGAVTSASAWPSADAAFAAAQNRYFLR